MLSILTESFFKLTFNEDMPTTLHSFFSEKQTNKQTNSSSFCPTSEIRILDSGGLWTVRQYFLQPTQGRTLDF